MSGDVAGDGAKSVRVEVWSDVVCPWCYIAKWRLEKALARFAHAGEVQVVWRSFQLEPSFPPGVRTPVHEYLAAKFGRSIAEAREMTDHVKALAAREGLAFDASRVWMVNTFDAHRVAHLAKKYGLLGQMQERLMRAHHTEVHFLGETDRRIDCAIAGVLQCLRDAAGGVVGVFVGLVEFLVRDAAG